MTCLLKCKSVKEVSFDGLGPPTVAGWNASGVDWNNTRDGLAFLPLPYSGFARTRPRICSPGVATTLRDACHPVGSPGYTINSGGHTAVASYTGPVPTIAIASATVVRNYKSIWISNPDGPLSFRGFNLAGTRMCNGTIPASPGARVDLEQAGCCAVALLTVGYARGLPTGTPFQVGDVKLCKVIKAV